MCTSVKLLAVDGGDGNTQPVCRSDERAIYYDILNVVAKDLRAIKSPQCFYDFYPILSSDVSPEELVDREIPSPPDDKTNMVGICFSGGGSRSLSLTRGGLATLFQLGFESKINYISMVSGGAWGAGTYYALSEYIRNEYLGNIVKDLSLLYWGDADDHNDKNIGWLHDFNLGRAPQRLGFFDITWHFFLNFYSQGTKLWSEYLADALLVPYGLDAGLSFEESLFSAKPDHMQLIVNAGVKSASSELVPLEITPSGIGARVPVDDIGDAYVLPPKGFGRKALGVKAGYLWVAEGKGFTLGDMHAVTSANYVHKVSMFWDMLSALGIAVPSFAWLNVNLTSGKLSQDLHQVVDSGLDEYLGLMPLLARGVRKVVAFVNTDTPIVKGNNVIGIEKVIPSYFGIVPDQPGKGDEYRYALPDADGNCGKYCLKNQIFPSEYYPEVVNHLWQAKQDGKPIVFLQKNLPVIDNAKYSLKGGGLVDILWVYNDLPNGWFELFDDSLKEKVAGSDQFLCHSNDCQPHGYRFPHYKAMTELNLSRAQVNMLFHLQTWTLLNSRKELEELFGVLF